MSARLTSLFTLVLLTAAVSIATSTSSIAADDAPAGKGTVNIEDLETEWDALVDRRNKLSKKLQILSEEFETLQPTAANPKPKNPKRIAEIQKEFEESVEEFNTKTTPRMEAILPTLAKAKYKAYLANPKDKKAEDILFNYLQMSYVAKQRYSEVAAIGQKLIAVGNKHPMVLNLTGASLFCEHQFSEAKSVLDMASKDKSEEGQGIFAEIGERFLADCNDYLKYWAKEQAIREQEKTAPDDMKNPHVLLTTTKGDIEIELFEDQAPNTVANFISLIEKGKYDNVGFHRVIPGFMAQGGDPNTLNANPGDDGSGGPGYTIKCECNRKDARMHFSGSLSMAHAGQDTGGSQFFITYIPTSHLNNRHTVFGRVVKGLDVAKDFEKIS
ncbi:MAG: peptidylprolyl isomerase, partial [Planctomycetaceae bacterium]|nr:peptidylprolyl isomerase [Planctomycetaceae bacterium]